VTVILALAIAGCGIAVGWIARGALDRAVTNVVLRVLTHSAGKEAVAKALSRYIDESRGAGRNESSKRD
jgi:hypothetical protein